MTPKEFFNLLMEYPQPARTEVLAELETLTRNYNEEYTTALLSDFEELLNDWKYSKITARLEAEYNENVLAPYYEALHCAEYAIAMGCNDPIEWPGEPAPFTPPPPFHGCYDDTLIFVSPMYEYAVEVLKSKLITDTSTATPKEVSEGLSLPIDLGTERARKYFARALDENMMEVTGAGCKWLKPQVWLGYLCSKIYEHPRPISLLEKYFDVRNLAASITKAEEPAKRTDVKLWRKYLDEKIFFD